MTDTIDPMRSLEVLHKYGPLYAKAKAERVFIEESLRSIKSLEMQRSGETTAAAQERDAYASDAYRTAVAGLREAVEREEAVRWKLVAAQCAADLYRTMEASNRRLDKACA